MSDDSTLEQVRQFGDAINTNKDLIFSLDLRRCYSDLIRYINYSDRLLSTELLM